DRLTFTWAFGDGATGSTASASHVYATAKTYTVTLTVGDGQLSDVSTTTVAVALANRPPTVTAGGPYAAVNGASLTFAATGSDPDGDPLTLSWDFGDGGVGAGQSVIH